MEFNHSTETISPDDTVPVITIGGTGGIKIPAGDTSTRPTGQGEGVLRLNTTGTGVLEYNDNADNWTELASVEYVNAETSTVVATTRAEIGAITWDMTGFPNRDVHSTLSINESTRTVTLTPIGPSMELYYRGVRYDISTALSIVFNDTYGGHYICFDPTTQQLIDVGAQASIREDVLVAYVFWDDVNNKAIIFGDERHGSSRDVEWHYAQHRNVGAVWRSGGGITYDLNASALVSFSLGNTTIADEDIEHFIVDAVTPANPYEQTLSPAANVPVLYLTGTSNKYVQTTSSTLPWLPNGTNGTYYNDWNGGDWTLSAVPEGYYVVYWLIATNDMVNPVKLVLGRTTHLTIDDAISETFDAYNLPLAECVPLYQFTLHHSLLYTLNPCRVQISAVRAISSRETVASDAFVAENHGNLTGRNAADQHPISAITDLQSTLDGKLTKTNLTVATAAATAAKTTNEAVTFVDGVLYNVLFTLGNSVSTPTINGVGVRLGTTAASTTTFAVGANAVVPMLYVAATNTLQLTGSYRVNDSTEDYRMSWDISTTAGASTTRYKILMQSNDGKYYPISIGDTAAADGKTISTQPFVIGAPILYYSNAATVAANALFGSTTLLSEVTVSTFAYTANQVTGWSLYTNVYLVGTVNSAGLFTLDNTTTTSFMTQTLPTTEDGKVYILLGQVGNSATLGQFRLFLHNQAFVFKNGSLQLYSSRDSYVTLDNNQTITGSKTFSGSSWFSGDVTFASSNVEFDGTVTMLGTTNLSDSTSITMDVTSSLTTPALQVTGGTPGVGKVLTSDATGNATWQASSSGVTSMADGTVAAPGWAFTNETDVGFHRPSAGSLSIVSNNGEQVRVNGVTNAVNYVTLSGNTAGNGPVIGVDGASTNVDLYFRTKGAGAVYAMNASDGLIYGVFNGAGATASTQYLTFTNAAAGGIPYVQSNGTDATIPIRYLSKSATGYHQFSTTTNNDILTLQSVASGVNNLTITNAVSASSPTISATGSATNININLTPKGSGGVNLTSGPLLIAGASGTSGQVLTSNGTGAPSWQSVNVTVGSTDGVPIITTTGGALSAGSFGTTAGTFCQGNDSRLSDARTPLSHTHGNITNAGAIGSTSGLPIITTTGGLLTAGSFGTTAGTFCQGNDSRLNDTRNTTNSHTLKFDSGTTEGTDQYTFNGSAAKTINLVAGTNISMSKTAGQITINSTYAYTLPVATANAYGGVKLGSDTLQTTAANTPTTTTNRTYAVQLNNFDQMLVNVPWVNDNFYPTAFSWSAGDASGPTGTLTVLGASSVSFGAIPSASETTSGIITTGTQVISGSKTLRNSLTIKGSGSSNDQLVIASNGKAAGTSYTGFVVLPSLTGNCTYELPSVSGIFVTTGDTGTVTNTMLAGSIANAKLTNSSVTINGTAVSLGGSATITANTTNSLTLGTGLTATSGTFNGSAANTVSVTYGSTAGTACQGNDSRLSDARTPLSHIHGNITNTGAIGSTSGLPIITTTSGVLTTGTFGTTSGTFCQGNDSRLNDTRNTTNAMTLRFGGGTTEGTDQYTFNGSAAKTINFVAGANISLTESAGQVTIAATSGGGTPGGSTGQMQYNNAGAFAGSANVLIENDNLKLMPLASIPTAPTDGLVMFDRIRGGRHLPSIIGPSGVDVALQPALFGNSVYMWLPGTGTTLGINWGTSFTARNSGTGAVQNHPTKTSTNAMTSMNRATFSTGTTTTGASGIQSSSTVAWRGNAAGLGGFFFFARFGIETLATGQRAFVGLSANNATMAADPSSWNNTCGIGEDSADTTWQIIMRGTSATKTNTGITVTAGQILDFAMFAAPNGSSITCRVADAVTGAVLYDNTTFTTNLPTNTTFLYMQAHTQSTSGTTAKLLALNRMYVETDL